jgi:hypothetical protein
MLGGESERRQAMSNLCVCPQGLHGLCSGPAHSPPVTLQWPFLAPLHQPASQPLIAHRLTLLSGRTGQKLLEHGGVWGRSSSSAMSPRWPVHASSTCYPLFLVPRWQAP